MKNIVVFLALFMSFSLFARAEDQVGDCGTKGLTQPMAEASPYSERQSAILEDDLKKISKKLCYLLDMTFGYEDAAEKLENLILYHLNISRGNPRYKEKVLAFWNNNSPYLICEKSSKLKPNARAPQHLMKRVLDMNMDAQIFDEFLLFDSEEFPINVNAVEVYNGRRETLLDYLNDIIETPSRHRHYQMNVLTDLKDILIEEYGAKTAAQLCN